MIVKRNIEFANQEKSLKDIVYMCNNYYYNIIMLDNFIR